MNKIFQQVASSKSFSRMSKLNDYYVDIEDDESSGSDNDLHTHDIEPNNEDSIENYLE